MTARAALLALIVGTPAVAHSWYDAWCCSDSDCTAIPAHTVNVTADGYVVTLTPADHPMVKTTVTKTFRFPDADPLNDMVGYEARWSMDENYHACVLPNSQVFRCLYVPPAGY